MSIPVRLELNGQKKSLKITAQQKFKVIVKDLAVCWFFFCFFSSFFKMSKSLKNKIS